MKIAWTILIISALTDVAIAGCMVQSPKPLTLDFSCVSERRGEQIVSSCADAESWKKYYHEQQREQQRGSYH